jgi:hypothetical protein
MPCSRYFSLGHCFNHENPTNQPNKQEPKKLKSNPKPMKINKLVVIGGVLTVIIISNPLTAYGSPPTPAPSASPVITWTATGKQSKNVDVLFVQNAKNMSFSEGKLVLRGVNPVTVCFTDRPARMAGHMQTSKFVPLWSQGKDSFLKDNPNATLSVFGGDNVSDLVVELSNPQLSGDDLTYDARLLEGTPPAIGGACALFIDIIGMPATPMSYAGVARRSFRRGY